MIREIVLRGGLASNQQRLLSYGASYLRREPCCEPIRAQGELALPDLQISLADWQHPRADIFGFDRLLNSVEARGDFRLTLWTRDWLDGVYSAYELLNRYQRFLPLPGHLLPMPRQPEVLAVHAAQHPQNDSAARLLHDQSLDAWRWVQRLSPEPSVGLELAALFGAAAPAHLAADAGLDCVRNAVRALEPLALAQRDTFRMAELVLEPDARQDPERQTLSDARDLAFFGVASWAFQREHGVRITRSEVEQRLARMSETAICVALMTRQPLPISRMFDEILDAREERDSDVRIA